jgi:hypothetical protein
VVESFFKAKKYIVPSVVVSPIFAGCVAAAYVATGAGHFEPARGAMVFVVGGEPERPLGREDRRAYQLQLKHFLAGAYPEKPGRKVGKAWARIQSKGKTGVDDQGRPVLEVKVGESQMQVGAVAGNVLDSNAPPEVVRQLLEARLQAELRQSRRGLSETEIARDWELLQKTMSQGDSPVATHIPLHSENIRGNQP